MVLCNEKSIMKILCKGVMQGMQQYLSEGDTPKLPGKRNIYNRQHFVQHDRSVRKNSFTVPHRVVNLPYYYLFVREESFPLWHRAYLINHLIKIIIKRKNSRFHRRLDCARFPRSDFALAGAPSESHERAPWIILTLREA